VHAGFRALNAGGAAACLARLAPDFAINLAELPGSRRTVEYVSHEFYRVAGGLIAEEWICADMATLLRQLS
jgi:predicted ester cyclase